MRSAVRLNSSSLGLPGKLSFPCPVAPMLAIRPLMACRLTSVVCSIVPLPSGFTRTMVPLLMQPVSDAASETTTANL